MNGIVYALSLDADATVASEMLSLSRVETEEFLGQHHIPAVAHRSCPDTKGLLSVAFAFLQSKLSFKPDTGERPSISEAREKGIETIRRIAAYIYVSLGKPAIGLCHSWGADHRELEKLRIYYHLNLDAQKGSDFAYGVDFREARVGED